MNRLGRLVLGLILLAFSFSSIAEVGFLKTPSKTKEAIRWFHPRLDFTAAYDDNVFLEPTDEQDDFSFITSPGIFIVVPFDANTHAFTLDYQADLIAFAEFDDQNFIAHTLKGSLDLNFPKFHINTSDIFRRSDLRADTEFTERIDRYENTYDLAVGTSDWNRLSFEVGYNFFSTFYDDDTLEVIDYYQHKLRGTGFYRLFTKTKALLEYEHIFISYPDAITARDGDADRVSIGLKGEPFTRLILEAKVGYENRDYDNGQDLSNAVIDLSATKYFTTETVVSLAYQRAARESTFLDNNFYFANSVSGTLNQKLFWGLDGVLGLSYSNNEYDEMVVLEGIAAERDDDLFGVQAGLNYQIREWLNTGLSYFYFQRDSNFESLEYTDNRVVWKTSANF